MNDCRELHHQPFLVNMTTRSKKSLLSNDVINRHIANGSGKSLLRRHECTLLIIKRFQRCWCPTSQLTEHSVPPKLIQLCTHFNRIYCYGREDEKVDARSLWGIIFRKDYSGLKIKNTTHPYLYIQERHPDGGDHSQKRMVRRKPLCTSQIGEDLNTIQSNVSIFHPPGRTMLYAVKGLHHRCHGSSPEVLYNNKVMDEHGIINRVIRPPRWNSKKTLQSMNNIHVAYDNHPIFAKLHRRIAPGTHAFHHLLTSHLLTLKKTDSSRGGQKICSNESSLHIRMSFGFGRVQATPSKDAKTKCIHWQSGEVRMPTISVQDFIELKFVLKDSLVQLFTLADEFLQRNIPEMCSNPTRIKFIEKLNTELGHPNAKMRFEYYDIALFRNMGLPKHIDQKNDHRKGYNHCVVYTFYHFLEGYEYKISIIMTTRCTIGAVHDSTDIPVAEKRVTIEPSNNGKSSVEHTPDPDTKETSKSKRISKRHQLTTRQKKAANHIHFMSECQRDAFEQLEKMSLDPADMCVDSGYIYHKDMIGMFNCHLRALSNVNKDAGLEALSLGITHTEMEKINGILKKYEDGTNGSIFFLREKHWVALLRVPGSEGAIYLDDMVIMKMKNYNGSLAVLNVVQSLSPALYQKVFHGSN